MYVIHQRLIKGNVVLTKLTVFSLVLLTAMYVILSETLSALSVATGLAIGCACLFFVSRAFPAMEPTSLKLSRLVLYPAYIVGEVYLAGFAAIRLIIKGAEVDIVEIHTQIKDSFLRALLANSITLTPGTISLDLKDDTITVLWLREKSDKSYTAEEAGEQIKGTFERLLLAMHK